MFNQSPFPGKANGMRRAPKRSRIKTAIESILGAYGHFADN